MDGLALLCNLFADGPVTLGRLRGARVASLAELERMPPERLAESLHASVPQARAFAEEARKLVRRLSEEAWPSPTRAQARRSAPVAREPASAPAGKPLEHGGPAGARPLSPGLLPGLDETACARLRLHHVCTVQSLGESAGIALARRTGIPYSTLLELARHARRFAAERPRSLPEVELVPFLAHPRRAPAEAELARTDEFTLPRVPEPEAAGPFV